MIVSLSEFKAYLGITDNSQDVLLQLLLDSAQSTVETYTGRKFEVDTVDITEIFDGNAQKEIFLKKYPIISLTSVDYNAGDTNLADWQQVANTGYSIKSNIGLIDFLCHLQRGFQKYRVIYRGGYLTMPADLKIAVIKIASGNLNKKSSDGIKGETVNGDRIDFDTSEIPNDVATTLSSYRRPYV